MINSQYVLLTAAKDEEACIGEVIQAVLQQTVRPLAWFIMDDGSTDRTALIVRRFAAEHPFIRLQSGDPRSGRCFGSQYKAIHAAYDLAKSLEFDFVAVQDADQAPASADYYRSLLEEFRSNPRLGAASGFVYERPAGVWACRPDNSRDSVAASAVFRRSCFDGIGGYTPLHYGGSDWLMQLNVRMTGWEIFTRPDLHIHHYRLTSSAGGLWRGKFRAGMMDASFGSHALFEICKSCRRLPSHPFIFGSLLRSCGFFWWKVSGRKPLLTTEQVAFLRREQMAKLWKWLWPFDGGRTGKPDGFAMGKGQKTV